MWAYYLLCPYQCSINLALQSSACTAEGPNNMVSLHIQYPPLFSVIWQVSFHYAGNIIQDQTTPRKGLLLSVVFCEVSVQGSSMFHDTRDEVGEGDHGEIKSNINGKCGNTHPGSPGSGLRS
jgi:hypothetical protein